MNLPYENTGLNFEIIIFFLRKNCCSNLFCYKWYMNAGILEPIDKDSISSLRFCRIQLSFI